MSVNLAKLKSVIGYSKYSYHQLHKKAGLSRAAYRYWNGQRTFPLEVALKIALYLDVPASAFLSDDSMWLINNTKDKQ